jgi:hypothetical protein
MIAYASLAGLPSQAGLYTLLASLALYAIFGTSRHLVVAGTSASAVLVFSAVTALGPKDAGSYATLAAGMIVLTDLHDHRRGHRAAPARLPGQPPPGTSRSAWPTCTARPWTWPNGPGCSPWSARIASSRPRPPPWPGRSR